MFEGAVAAMTIWTTDHMLQGMGSEQFAEPYEELLSIADRMGELAKQGRQEDIEKPLESLKQAAEEIGRAWSGSWIGYHANVYYEDMKPPPPGDHFQPRVGSDGKLDRI